MTKIQANFQLERPLDEALLSNIRDAQALYGISWIRVSKALDELTVEYDATRYRPADLQATLKRCGLPVVSNWP